MHKAIFNWSGGKDSSLTLYHVLKDKDYDIQCLLTTFSQEHKRISMHGVRQELVELQAERIGIPLFKVMVPPEPTMDSYDQLMRETLTDFHNQGIKHSIFGDIFLEDLKKYREDQLKKAGFEGVFPIWKRPTTELAQEFIDLGFKAIIACVHDRYLDESFVGREYDQSFLDDLPDNVDPCGENGEFHSYVFDGPIFSSAIQIEKGKKVHKTYEPQDKVEKPSGFWYCDLLPVKEKKYV